MSLLPLCPWVDPPAVVCLAEVIATSRVVCCARCAGLRQVCKQHGECDAHVRGIGCVGSSKAWQADHVATTCQRWCHHRRAMLHKPCNSHRARVLLPWAACCLWVVASSQGCGVSAGSLDSVACWTHSIPGPGQCLFNSGSCSCRQLLGACCPGGDLCSSWSHCCGCSYKVAGHSGCCGWHAHPPCLLQSCWCAPWHVFAVRLPVSEWLLSSLPIRPPADAATEGLMQPLWIQDGASHTPCFSCTRPYAGQCRDGGCVRLCKAV